ncbi:hypothetical protein [Spongiimicrobium salis]|uniref:hypothetical protein n=1 Tax=Spongiimicrobium salis TaxID=1667022 RepID=UPI00374CE9FA
MNIEKTNIREKQAIGAICLKLFSSRYQITYPGVNELIQHQLNLLISDNLSEWNTKGINIEIPGRGDDLPEKLLQDIPKAIHKDFNLLIMAVTEIGIANMFTAFTEEPHIQMLDSLSIIKKHNIKINVPEILLNGNSSKDWGLPWTKEKFEKLKEEIEIL